MTLDSCRFGNCSYVLDGPAKDTLLFLTALYKIDPASIEKTIDNIRSGAQPVKLPSQAAPGKRKELARDLNPI